jgi:hypothetical protein
VRRACALGALNLSGVGEVGLLGKATNGERGNRPLRAQVHLLPVSCVVAASHRALDVTNRDEMSDVAFGRPSRIWNVFCPLAPPT